ncbi:hypothetical protein [Rhodopila sp.]|uniref:hypothetical protein n=1 Tax=Rhodopila sp. TaxID=2480087 RepID=UPI003D1376D4
MTPAWHKEAVRLHRTGLSVPDIAAATGKSAAQVRRAVRGVSASPQRAAHLQGRDIDPNWPREAVRLRRRGMQIAQIARKIGVTRQAVSMACRKAGLPSGKPGGDWRKLGMPRASEIKALGQKEGESEAV